MATSEVQICNSALVKVGAELILSLADDTKRAELCAHQYAICRDEVLASHPWNFAMAMAEIAEITPAPTIKYSNWFQLPADCLRVWKVLDPTSPDEWEVQGRKLLIDASTVEIQYIKKETDVTLFSPIFSEALSLRMAVDLSYNLIQNAGLASSMYELYQRKLAEARTYDAQEGQAPKGRRSQMFLNARF